MKKKFRASIPKKRAAIMKKYPGVRFSILTGDPDETKFWMWYDKKDNEFYFSSLFAAPLKDRLAGYWTVSGDEIVALDPMPNNSFVEAV